MVNISNMPSGVVDDLAFTEEELEELKRAREMPIVYDEDCPETTSERAMRFCRVHPSGGTSAEDLGYLRKDANI